MRARLRFVACFEAGGTEELIRPARLGALWKIRSTSEE
jgi:hypothetical protein